VTVLKDYQFELDGYAFGLDLPIFTQGDGFDTGDDTVIDQDQVNPITGANMMGRDVIGAGEWTWTLATRAEEPEEALAEVSKLASVWRNRGEGFDTGDIKALRYAVGGRTRRIYGRPRRFTSKPVDSLVYGLLAPLASFKRADALHYDDVEQVVTMTMKPAETGGAVLPATFPLTFERDPDYVPASAMLVGGDARTWPVISFTGPVTNPSVTIGDVTIALAGTIGEGGTVTIDTRPWARSVTRSGNTSGASLARATRMTRAAFRPGAYSAVYRGVDTSGNSRCQIRWRDAWTTF
jgi:hypothetical protein